MSNRGGPLTRPFRQSENQGPATQNHIMHYAYASNGQVIVLCLYGLAVAVMIIYAARELIPQVLDGGDQGLREWQLLQLVAWAGALGGLIHMATSLARFVAFRDLERSWFLFYLFRPPVGAGLAVIVYFVLQTGLLSPVSAGTNLNGGASDGVYRILALASLTGLFARQAIEKLSEVFDVMFRTKTDGREPPKPSESDPNRESRADQDASSDGVRVGSRVGEATEAATHDERSEEYRESKEERDSRG